MNNEQTTIEVITPDVARNWLKINTSNRPVREKHVQKLAQQMLRGEYVMNGEAIIISDDNRLLDGQHRLRACVESGVSIRSVVVRNVPHSHFFTIDTGAARTAGNVLSVYGEKNASTLAASCRVAIILQREKLSPDFGAEVSHAEIIEWLNDNPGIRKWADFVAASKGVRTLAEPSVIVPIAYFMEKKSPEKTEEFIGKISSGIGLEAGDPALLLRERLLANRTGKARLRKKEVAALICKAILAYVAGKKISTLRWSDGANEAFPKITGD